MSAIQTIGEIIRASRSSRTDALGNAQRSELFDYKWSLSKLKTPVDKTEWWMTPQTVNAVNLPLQNALNFPAAFLNPPYFDMNADPVENYGAIGATIGHEISHSFDDTGSLFDASRQVGELVDTRRPRAFPFGLYAARRAIRYL